MRIELLNNGGKPWKKIDGDFIKGYAFTENNLLNEKDIHNELVQSIRNNRIFEKLLLLNGNFSGIIRHQSKTYLFADKLRSYPLLYTKMNDDWIITDQAKYMMDAYPKYMPNDIAIMSYLSSGYLFENHTFLEKCYTVSAGTYVILDEESTIHKYHHHIYPKTSMSYEELLANASKSFSGAFRRMLESIGNRPIWIPLSGGYDSRLVACLCKKLGLSNVSCYTYGIENSNEVKISKQVAHRLGFPWYFIEYSEEKFLNLVKNNIDDEYMYWAMNLNTTSHCQDLIAINELKINGILKESAVVVPGHSGDIYGGSHTPFNLLNSNKTVAELIYHKYFSWNTLKRKYRTRILNNLGENLNSIVAKNNQTLANDLFSNWNIQNRQANFIINSVRAYEFFGVDWRIPLWDDELSRFWLSLPWESNLKNNIYNKYIFENYFIPMGVDFYKTNSFLQQFAAKIRLPFYLKSFVKKELSKLSYFKKRYDQNDFNYWANYYSHKLKGFSFHYININESSTHSIIALYHIYLLKKYFKV